MIRFVQVDEGHVLGDRPRCVRVLAVGRGGTNKISTVGRPGQKPACPSGSIRFRRAVAIEAGRGNFHQTLAGTGSKPIVSVAVAIRALLRF